MKYKNSRVKKSTFVSSVVARHAVCLETRYLRLILNESGMQMGLIDKTTGKNYLRCPTPLWKATVGGKAYVPSHITLQGYNLIIRFGKKAEAVFRVTNKVHYLTLELISVSPAVEQITMAELNLKTMGTLAATINASYNETYAFCVMALTLPVHCEPSGSALRATCYARYGFKGNKIALMGCPANRLKKLIRTIEKAEGLPHITLSGTWGKISPDIKRSYLFLHDLGESNCDRAIEYARKMNVGMIMILETWASRTMGHFPVDRRLFPRGRKGLKAVVAKIHQAGLKAGLHFLSTGVSCNDRYLTPIPDQRLFKDASTELARDIDAQQPTIFCADYPAGFPDALHPKGLYFGNGVDIQIDAEVISYGTCVKTPPGRFIHCRRGAYGTRAAPHNRGTKIVHLMRSYSYFVTDQHTSIVDEIAKRIAGIMDDGRFDMLYFDGAERLQGDHWYYNPKLLSTFYQHISPARRNHILFQGSSHSNFSWHQVSRAACADGYRNVKDNLNHASANYPDRFNNFLPLDIGWYGLAQKGISVSDIEYILCKSLGWNSSIGFSTSLSALDQNPETRAMIEMIGTYERLRRRHYFPKLTQAVLRRPGARHLVKRPGGQWTFFNQQEKTIRSMAGADNTWPMRCAKRQPIAELQISVGEVTAPGPAYHVRASAVMLDFKNTSITPFAKPQQPAAIPFGENVNAVNNTNAGFHYSMSNSPGGNGYGVFKVNSRCADRSGWTVFSHKCPAPFNLEFMQGIGFWIWGDGRGACLKMRLQDASAKWLDFTITLDFAGWQYRELANFEDIVVPDYRGKVDLANITHIFFFMTRLPPHTETSCRMTGLKALPELSGGRCVNPSITCGNQSLAFPVSLEKGEYLTCTSGRKYTVTDRHGRRRILRPIGNMPVFKKGRNSVCFGADSALANEITVRMSF